MSQELFINVMPSEVRAALVDDGTLIELIMERPHRASLVGNVYLGRIQRVMNGMEAAFVDIGLRRAGFLGLDAQRAGAAGPAIDAPVHEGQAVPVQIVKDAIGGKGVQLSRRITLPGRYVVYAPQHDRVMVSRQIEDESERARLTDLMTGIAAPGEGFILRTASVGATASDLEADAARLRETWAEIEKGVATLSAPACLHADIDPILRILRDNALETISAIHVDDGAAATSARAYCDSAMPGMSDRVRLHSGPQPLFEQFAIEEQIEEACGKRIALPSGGGIVIETTEALTAVDVNSGRFEGAGDLERTAFRTNLEAAREAARQIRLRNIAGLTVVDFIHMEEAGHWDEVIAAMREVVARDRNPTRVIGATGAGLVEITRRRRREPLLQSMTDACAACGGLGRIRSVDAVAMDILRALKRVARVTPPGPLVLHAAPEVVESLENGYADSVAEISRTAGRLLRFRPEGAYRRESYDFVLDA